MSWVWFHKLGSPKWFYQVSNHWVSSLGILSLLCLIVGAVWGLAFAPPDYLQGNSFRIIYIHVPAAFLAQSVYVMMAVAGIVFLVWRMKMAELFLAQAAPLGTAITLIALITGSIWGKPTWGTWWVWDARLTSMLILLFLYLGVLALHQSMDNKESAGRACSVLCLVGVINIPIIKYSVEWWNTLHQPATFTLTQKPTMVLEMWMPLLICTLGFYLGFATLVLYRMRTEIIWREYRSQWLKLSLQTKSAHEAKASNDAI